VTSFPEPQALGQASSSPWCRLPPLFSFFFKPRAVQRMGHARLAGRTSWPTLTVERGSMQSEPPRIVRREGVAGFAALREGKSVASYGLGGTTGAGIRWQEGGGGGGCGSIIRIGVVGGAGCAMCGVWPCSDLRALHTLPS
jgi:hypothetical protein